MGLDEIALLIGLGLVYAVAFRVAGACFVLWPLLTPLGSLFNQLATATFTLPMESILVRGRLRSHGRALCWHDATSDAQPAHQSAG
jgi:hypothetical protein